jgi:catechol-2,3-dioxygenase
VWVNHLAFDAPTIEALDAARQRWQDHGETVSEIDHGWCRSIYTMDPNGILVEFCCSTRAFTDEDRAEADRLLRDPHPPLEAPPGMTIHRPTVASPS